MFKGKEEVLIDLQIQKIMDAPEKVYKEAMRQAYKNIGSGMRSVIRSYQQGIIDARSMFNDSYLTALGYNPKETIPYSIVDPILVRSWLLSNVNSNISDVNSYKWSVPSLEEIALEYLQDTYSGMVLKDKSFLIDSVRWYVSGVTNVSTTMTNATCYKDRLITAEEYVESLILDTEEEEEEEDDAERIELVVASVEDRRYTIAGVNYWKVTMTNGSIVDVPIEYTTIECPGVGSDVVQAIITEYNGKEYPVQSSEYDTDDMGVQTPVWTNTVRVSAYIGSDGDLKVTGTAPMPEYDRYNSSRYLEATKEAVANIVDQVEKEIAADLIEELDRLIVVYTLNGVQKLKLAEINKSLISSAASASAYPIIPLRENYAFVKETNQMKAMLNKLGMAGDDFETSLNNPKLKNAAIMFLLDLKDDSEVGTKVVYETLYNMVRTTIPASGKGTTESETYQLDLGFSDLNMRTRVSFGLSIKSGIVAEVGKYVRYSYQVEYTEEVGFGGADQYWTETVTKIGTIYGIRKQVSESYYEEMTFGRCSTKVAVGGYGIKSVIEDGLASGLSDGEVYIPITDLGLNGLRYEELHYAVARSMSMLVVAITKVKVKWYQSGFFKFVVLALLIVTRQYWAIVLFFATEAGLIGGKTAIVLSLLTMNFSGIVQIAQGATITTMRVLSAASTLVQLASIAVSVNTLGVMEAIESKQKAMQANLEASEEQLKEIAENTQQGLWMGIQDRTPDTLYALSSTYMMCNNDVLYDYDSMYDGMIASVGI